MDVAVVEEVSDPMVLALAVGSDDWASLLPRFR
jgi:hypothetical protein